MSLILRHESELPGEVRALLHGPAPIDVWYLPSHPRISNPFRVAAAISLVMLIGTMGLFLMTVFESVSAGRFRSESPVITLVLVICAAVFHLICGRAKNKAKRLEVDLKEGRVHFGLWITAQHVLVHDNQGIECALKRDIVKTHMYWSGAGRGPDLLVLTLSNRTKLRIMVAMLDSWTGRGDTRESEGEKLRSEVEVRLRVDPGISKEQMQQTADVCRQRRNDFNEFLRWLDGEAQRLKSGSAEKSALLVMADAALAAWPDAARSPNSESFMFVETNGVWEYGVNSNNGPDAFYLGFKKNDASWLLPLSRTIYFFEAESIFTDVASVHDCAATFQNVPVTEIHFKGGMDPTVFDAFLAWVATKPMKVLDGTDYRPEPNGLSNLDDFLRTRLTDFKKQHHFA